MPAAPITIDPTNLGCLSVGEWTGTTIAPVFPIGTYLYKVLLNQSTWTVEVARSNDGGVTWTVLDGSHGPATAPTYDAAAYLDTAGGRIVVATTDGSGNAVVTDFALGTLTWGTAYGSGTAPAGARTLIGLYLRPDGSRLLLWSAAATLDDGSLTDGILNATVFDATDVWGATVIVNSNFFPPPVPSASPIGSASAATAVMDPTGRLHVFWGENDLAESTPPLTNPVAFMRCYQAIETDLSLGSHASDFPALPQAPSDPTQPPYDYSPFFGQPAVCGEFIIMPTQLGVYTPAIDEGGGVFTLAKTEPGTVYIGTPLSAPAWTQSANIWPHAYAGTFAQDFFRTPPFAFSDGTKIYVIAVMGLAGPPD